MVPFIHLYQGSATFFCKGAQRVTRLEFAGHTVPVAATQHCQWRVKAATDRAETNGCSSVLIKLYLQSLVVGQSWTVVSSLLTSDLCYYKLN